MARRAGLDSPFSSRMLAGAPLTVEGKTIGVVAAASLAHREFREDDLELMRMVADRVAPAMERSRRCELGVSLAGGSLAISSAPGAGTAVRARFEMGAGQ